VPAILAKSVEFAGEIANSDLRMWFGERERISSGPAFGMDSPGGKNGESVLYAEARRMIGQIAMRTIGLHIF
jgi:hypothetical protein